MNKKKIKCPECGWLVNKLSGTCPECGSKIVKPPKVCKTCGKEIFYENMKPDKDKNIKFTECPHCGNSIY